MPHSSATGIPPAACTDRSARTDRTDISAAIDHLDGTPAGAMPLAYCATPKTALLEAARLTGEY